MLDSDLVLSSVLASLQSIPQLATELGAPEIPATESITAHYGFNGEEDSWIRTLATMRSPSMAVGYLDYTMGNYDGATVWKHRLNLAVRAKNRAQNPGASSAQHLWWMAMNLPVSVPEVAPNIRYVDLAGGMLWLFETTLRFQTDELGADFFIGTIVFNEYGDAGPDNLEFLCVGPAVAHVTTTVEGFTDAIFQYLSAEDRRQLLEQLAEEGVTSNGDTHTK